MSTVTKEQVITYIENLSVIDLSNLVKELETKFGVSAAPVAVAMAGGAAGGAAAAAEKTEFDVVLTSEKQKTWSKARQSL